MHVYNLTAVIEKEVFPQWAEWIKNTYLPQIKNNSKITEIHFFEVLVQNPEKTIAIHHGATSEADLRHFITDDIPELMQKCATTFGDKVLLFGTELTEIFM